MGEYTVIVLCDYSQYLKMVILGTQSLIKMCELLLHIIIEIRFVMRIYDVFFNDETTIDFLVVDH